MMCFAFRDVLARVYGTEAAVAKIFVSRRDFWGPNWKATFQPAPRKIAFKLSRSLFNRHVGFRWAKATPPSCRKSEKRVGRGIGILTETFKTMPNFGNRFFYNGFKDFPAKLRRSILRRNGAFGTDDFLRFRRQQIQIHCFRMQSHKK